jgi:hypothetical protein
MLLPLSYAACHDRSRGFFYNAAYLTMKIAVSARTDKSASPERQASGFTAASVMLPVRIR